MNAPRRKFGFDDLRAVIDRSIRSAEIRRFFDGVEFTKYIDSAHAGGAGQTPYYYAALALGFELCCDGGGLVKLAYLYAPGAKHGFSPYEGSLPAGLTWGSTPAEVRLALGTPSVHGLEQLVPMIGKVGPWDRYDRPDVVLHFQYDTRGRQLSVVTLMAPDRIP